MHCVLNCFRNVASQGTSWMKYNLRLQLHKISESYRPHDSLVKRGRLIWGWRDYTDVISSLECLTYISYGNSIRGTILCRIRDMASMVASKLKHLKIQRFPRLFQKLGGWLVSRKHGLVQNRPQPRGDNSCRLVSPIFFIVKTTITLRKKLTVPFHSNVDFWWLNSSPLLT